MEVCPLFFFLVSRSCWNMNWEGRHEILMVTISFFKCCFFRIIFWCFFFCSNKETWLTEYCTSRAFDYQHYRCKLNKYKVLCFDQVYRLYNILWTKKKNQFNLPVFLRTKLVNISREGKWYLLVNLPLFCFREMEATRFRNIYSEAFFF